MWVKVVLLMFGVTLAAGKAVVENDLSQNISPQIENHRQSRDYYGYYDDDKKHGGGHYEHNDYQYQHIPAIITKEETSSWCPPTSSIPSLGPFLGNGLNFLVLKLGALGIIKSIGAILFFVLLFKIPLLIAKAVFVKSVIFPALFAPILLILSNLLGSNNMMMMMMTTTPKPAGNRSLTYDEEFQERSLDERAGTAAWQSFRFFMDSDKCAERFACHIGSLNNDQASGTALSRMTKYLEQASPKESRGRIRSLREAFTDGNARGDCNLERYPCETPHLTVSQGESTFNVF